MYLFQSPDTLDLVNITHLYTTACLYLDLVNELDESMEITSHATTTFQIGTMLAGCTLIRLLKSNFSKYLDVDRSKAQFFLAVNLMKKFSIENNDGPAQVYVMLSQLWTSDRVFRNPDGTERPKLRIRSRLSMSLVTDCLWWWKEEFLGYPTAYPQQVPSTKGRYPGLSSHNTPTLAPR
jgi:hypothetical protein